MEPRSRARLPGRAASPRAPTPHAGRPCARANARTRSPPNRLPRRQSRPCGCPGGSPRARVRRRAGRARRVRPAASRRRRPHRAPNPPERCDRGAGRAGHACGAAASRRCPKSGPRRVGTNRHRPGRAPPRSARDRCSQPRIRRSAAGPQGGSRWHRAALRTTRRWATPSSGRRARRRRRARARL